MNTKKRIFAISGSTRTHSTNESILKAIANLYQETLDIEVFTKIDTLPPFNPDVKEETTAPAIKSFLEKIDKADGVIICTPEYVFSLPGMLKNALEWTVSTVVFSDKPTALIVASASGEKAYESLLLIMNTLGAKIGKDAALLIRGTRSKVDTFGHLSNETTLSEIHHLIASFVATMQEKKLVER
jgi:chromate reductase, NAD(P)H dehydrogenase (quinone)